MSEKDVSGIELEATSIVAIVWACVDFDEEGQPWLDNIQAVARVQDALKASSGWRSMDSAPKDASYILLYFGDGHRYGEGNLTSVGYWSPRNSCWWLDALMGGERSNHQPTHWMPLPDPPGQATKGE